MRSGKKVEADAGLHTAGPCMMTKVANVSTFVKANVFDTVLTPKKLKFSDNGVLLREQSWHLPMQIVICSADFIKLKLADITGALPRGVCRKKVKCSTIDHLII